MDVGGISASSRLFEALEKLATSEGAGLVSSGPSPVPPDLARAFEQLLQEPGPELQENSLTLDVQSPGAGDIQPASGVRHPQDGIQDGIAESLEGCNTTSGHTTPDVPLMSHTELYQLQFQLAMLKIQSTTGSQVSQKAAQGFDSLLRSQS